MKSFRALLADISELTKTRIILLSLMMAALGYSLASEGHVKLVGMSAMLLGLTLVGASCGILNEYLERDIDARMWRTMNRPLPSGRISPTVALTSGILSGVLGELVLLIWVNPITAVLGAVTLLFYVGIYTPSKRVSSMSTLIGAIPGAMPPLMGWTAAYNGLAPEGLLLFAILFLWQIPHFLSIAWLYREDYARADLPILSVIDEKGAATAKQVILYSVVLLPLTLVPTVWGVTGRMYFLGALGLGLTFLASGMSLAVHRTKPYAKRLFFMSIVYLPALGLLMVWDRVF
jgi:protoheme IX farnesyltransferase